MDLSLLHRQSFHLTYGANAQPSHIYLKLVIEAEEILEPLLNRNAMVCMLDGRIIPGDEVQFTRLLKIQGELCFIESFWTADEKLEYRHLYEVEMYVDYAEEDIQNMEESVSSLTIQQ